MQKISCSVCRSWSNVVHDHVVVNYKKDMKLSNWLMSHFAPEITLLQLHSRYDILDGRSVQKCTNLTSLTLIYYQRLYDDTLSKLSKLTDLKLIQCPQISNNCIVQLTQLTSLALFGNKSIENEALSKLKLLTNLDLSFNERISNDSLIGLTNLTSLSLVRNSRISIRALQKLPLLTELNLSKNY